MATPSSGSKAQMELHQRLTKVETQINHIERAQEENRNATAKEIATLRDDFNDKIDDVVRASAADSHELKVQIQDTNREIRLTNETLNKINNKLSIHTFVFGVLAAVSVAAMGAFFKRVFDWAISF